MEILLPAELEPSPTMPNIRALLNKYVPPPQGSPIFNHDARNLVVLGPLGEAHGLNWQQLYWGSNLARLQSIKSKYDPQAISLVVSASRCHLSQMFIEKNKRNP